MVSQALPRLQRLNLRVIPSSISTAYGFLLLMLLALRTMDIPYPFLLTLLVSMTPFLFIFLPLALVAGIIGRSRVAVVLSLILISFALFWLGSIFVPRAVGQANGQPLSVVTFNAGGKTRSRANAENWMNNHPSDIFLMQETYFVQMNPGIESVRRTYPYQVVQSEPYRGNTTLSVYPIEDEGQEGTEADEPFTRVVIDFNGTQIAVYNVSLAAPFAVDGENSLSALLLNYNTELRDQQVEALIERLSHENLPTIVGGDFNLTEFEPAYSRLAEVLNDSFRIAGQGLGFTFPSGGIYSFGLPQPVMRIDYIWYSDEFRALSAEVGETLGSDHLPLTVQLDFIGS